MPKLFISHSSADKNFAKRLSKTLRSLGHEVWLDEWNISVGEDIVEEVNKGIETSDFIILVLTKSLISSNWTKREWGTRLFEDQQDGKYTILPLLKQDCDIPSILKTKKYADFRNSYAIGVGQLEAALSKFISQQNGSALDELNAGIDLIASKIEKKESRPELIISFERTSGILASILAQKMKIQEVLCINRRISSNPSPSSDDHRIVIGDGITLNANRLNALNPVIVVFHLFTGENLTAGLRYLERQGLERPPIFCLYISNVGKQRWPDIEWVYENSDVYQTHSRLPWCRDLPHII